MFLSMFLLLILRLEKCVSHSIVIFDIWDLLINSFCNQVNTVTTSNITAIAKFKTELKRKFPEVFFFQVLGRVQE